MQINKAALEIFDFTSSLAVYSEHELKVGDQAIQDYIANHVVKAFKDPGARTGTLHDASPWLSVSSSRSFWNLSINPVSTFPSIKS